MHFPPDQQSSLEVMKLLIKNRFHVSVCLKPERSAAVKEAKGIIGITETEIEDKTRTLITTL